jgi:hypothetical protein
MALLASLVLAVVASNGDPSPPPAHPFLLLSKSSLPALKARLAKPPFAARWANLLATADSFCKAPVAGFEKVRDAQGICGATAFAYVVDPAWPKRPPDAKWSDMPGITVDGNDILAVYDATRIAIELARDSGGPSLIECKTFRMTGHSAHDDVKYVPKHLFEEWEKKDPILRLETLLLKDKTATEADIKRLAARIARCRRPGRAQDRRRECRTCATDRQRERRQLRRAAV